MSSKLNFQIKDLLSGYTEILSAFSKYCPQNENTVRIGLFTVRSPFRRPIQIPDCLQFAVQTAWVREQRAAHSHLCSFTNGTSLKNLSHNSLLTDFFAHGIIRITLLQQPTEYQFLFRAGGGTSPTKPGNRSSNGHGANSCSQK